MFNIHPQEPGPNPSREVQARPSGHPTLQTSGPSNRTWQWVSAVLL